MLYHAPSKQFTVPLDSLQSSAACLRFAIKMIRQTAGLPLEGGERPAQMSDACHAEQAILDAFRMLGIDLGATRAGLLDLRNTD
ncbi:hypothetical protein HUT29_30065 [Pseudomonas chlororaphis]|jgi:hypothetical protein|uniref:hypothetical protein n=1 Tax=Pseudomonas chlororaphis TaxID=587753 RepID=UPI001B30D95C|nr:hypothetical protein [Pseudomonas chlororaphis]QTT85348.1 hypothetical protein HUT29_30065 [Pseudomonas chlororaphis]